MSGPLAPVPSSTLLRGARWRRSSRSTGMNNCVEAARLDDGLLAVRDSKHVARPALLFAADTWTSFLSAVRDEALGGGQRLP
ncbi:DUF397 domain-containing protein [Streptomyces chryseus]|uniref:DUF397 domain-containing protein n=1 Tax=Streptomyces chryseus TaxID=68186 RepID=A0ABQ3DVM3_9ACTN|nr:DUF397 domain-containing protein [Streptomyces chryseus]GGX17113.1 hypothetical protein GCM10010353_35400 [Streptomyces chryseus]GHB13344.1 hypothetical protein GCM10010346_41100 [Streptomyces chryseus]